MFADITEECKECDGKGEIALLVTRERCDNCGGTGRVVSLELCLGDEAPDETTKPQIELPDEWLRMYNLPARDDDPQLTLSFGGVDTKTAKNMAKYRRMLLRRGLPVTRDNLRALAEIDRG